MKIETQCLHEGYSPKNGEPRVMPIYQSTTYVYNSTDAVADVFDDPQLGMIYSQEGQIVYYESAKDDYVTQYMYMPDPQIKIKRIEPVSNIIYYEPIRIAFIGY